MYASVKKELAGHVLDMINDRVIDNTNKDDWHHILFNQDYYIIGYYDATEWLKRHGIDAFEAIGVCQEWEENVLGEMHKRYENAEVTVNMYVYVMGEELLNEVDAATIKELKEVMEEIING
jgi:predicted Ser/Thr protein kinase